MKDYYAILGVNATAEESLIHAAYSVKTQHNHTDSNAGEAVAKLEDINEAYAVLSNPAKRQAYDAERVENDAGANMQIPGLPRMQAQDPAYPVFVFKPKINLSKAQTLLLESFKSSATKLPLGSDINALVSCIYVPSWFISGRASGKWRAAGVAVDTQEVDCTQCGGKGTIEGEGYMPQCPLCHGSGKTRQRLSRKSTEIGAAKASVNEYVPSTFAGIGLKPDFSTLSRPAKATSQMITDLYCLQPEQDHEMAKELLSERLALALKNKALESLSQYDSVEGPHFGSTEAYVFSKVELRFYPLYVCQYGARVSKQLAVCDGITGKVDIPQQKSLLGLSRNLLAFRNLLVLAVLGAALGSALYFGKGLWAGADASKSGAIAKVSTQVKEDTNMVKQLLAASKKPEQQAQPSHTVTPAPTGTMSAAPKPAKKGKLAIQERPSFDCSTARIKAEKVICTSKELAEDDRKLAAVFEQKKQSASFEASRNKLIVEQMDWIEHVRNSCVNETCLLNAYRKRMETLSETNLAKKTELCPIPGHC
jgi:hypothetical protein